MFILFIFLLSLCMKYFWFWFMSYVDRYLMKSASSVYNLNVDPVWLSQ